MREVGGEVRSMCELFLEKVDGKTKDRCSYSSRGNSGTKLFGTKIVSRHGSRVPTSVCRTDIRTEVGNDR